MKQERGASLRAIVFERDHGVCAICGVDTELVRESLEALRRMKFRGLRELMAATRVRAGASLWEADHVRPLVEGGEHSLTNMRTLCAVGPLGGCHKRVTAELAARLSKRPRKRGSA